MFNSVNSNNPQSVAAPVVSAWNSKINWTNAVAIIATLLAIATGNKLDLTPEMQTGIVTAIGVGSSIASMVMKTYFTQSITPSSAKTMGSA